MDSQVGTGLTKSDPSLGNPVAPNSPVAKSPPHPLDGQWHLHINGETYGPYSGHQIKEYAADGRVNANSQVLPAGGEKWLIAVEDKRLAAIFRDQAKPAPPPINAAAGATVVQVTNQITPPTLLAGLEMANAKSPGVALLLSFLFCGLGQMYNGQVAKGILMLIGCVVLWLVFLGWTIWLWSVIDAYQTAKQMNLVAAQRIAHGIPV